MERSPSLFLIQTTDSTLNLKQFLVTRFHAVLPWCSVPPMLQPIDKWFMDHWIHHFTWNHFHPLSLCTCQGWVWLPHARENKSCFQPNCVAIFAQLGPSSYHSPNLMFRGRYGQRGGCIGYLRWRLPWQSLFLVGSRDAQRQLAQSLTSENMKGRSMWPIEALLKSYITIQGVSMPLYRGERKVIIPFYHTVHYALTYPISMHRNHYLSITSHANSCS